MYTPKRTKSSKSRVSAGTRKAIEGFYEALDTPVSLSCWLLFKHGEFRQLVEKRIDPIDYSDRVRFRLDYLAVKFLSKSDFLDTGIDTGAVARMKYYECELKCQKWNETLSDRIRDPASVIYGKPVREVISFVTEKLGSLLGEADFRNMIDYCRFSPGSTTRVTGTMTSAYEKLQEFPHSTLGAFKYVSQFCAKYDLLDRGLRRVPGNKLDFVPKNAKTDRPIAIEPDWNVFLQLGVGGYMSVRLRRVGVDIRDQTRNQQLAHLGSVTGSLATIDMASASDSLSQALIMELFPVDWYILLDALRSPYYKDGASYYKTHKFSSMGNGFTFPLQTLLFWAMSLWACSVTGSQSQHIGVYGDDIIVPVRAVPALASCFDFFGLTMNSSKSFWSSPFRESCGKDYFDGLDCQPWYLRKDISDDFEWYKAANAVKRIATLRSGLDNRYERLWNFCFHSVPKRRRHLIPHGYGDGGFHVDFDMACPARAGTQKRTLGWEGWLYRHAVRRAVTYEGSEPQALLRTALWRMVEGSELPCYGSFDHRRKSTVGVQRSVAIQWPSLGPWF